MSSKNQIVVPKEAREALDLRPGDRLLVSVRADGTVEMQREPRDLAAKLEGVLAGAPGEGEGGGKLWEELA